MTRMIHWVMDQTSYLGQSVSEYVSVWESVCLYLSLSYLPPAPLPPPPPPN